MSLNNEKEIRKRNWHGVSQAVPYLILSTLEEENVMFPLNVCKHVC